MILWMEKTCDVDGEESFYKWIEGIYDVCVDRENAG